MRILALLLCSSGLLADDVSDLASRIEALSAKEAPAARMDTLQRTEGLLEGTRPDLAARFRALLDRTVCPATSGRQPAPEVSSDPAAAQRQVEEVERNGDDPAAYEALANAIRANQWSAGLDNPSIRARIALADLQDLLNPAFRRLDGTAVHLGDYAAKDIVLAFWATWCLPCRAELLRLEKDSTNSTDRKILAISWEDPAVVRRFLEKHPYKLDFLIDAGHKVGDHFRITKLPASVTVRGVSQDCQPPPRAR